MAKSFCINTLVGITNVVVNETALTVNINDLLLDCDAESLTVTVYVVSILATLGVPEI